MFLSSFDSVIYSYSLIQIDTDTNELHNNVQSALAIQADLGTVLGQVCNCDCLFIKSMKKDQGFIVLQLTMMETTWKYDATAEWWNLLKKKLMSNKQRSDVR